MCTTQDTHLDMMSQDFSSILSYATLPGVQRCNTVRLLALGRAARKFRADFSSGCLCPFATMMSTSSAPSSQRRSQILLKYRCMTADKTQKISCRHRPKRDKFTNEHSCLRTKAPASVGHN